MFGSRHHSSWHDAAGGRRVCLCLCQAALKSGVSAHESDAAASDSARLDPASSQGPWLEAGSSRALSLAAASLSCAETPDLNAA